MQCGRMLEVFCSHLSDDETASFVQSVVKTSLFQDVPGSIQDLILQFPDKKRTVGPLIESFFMEHAAESDEDNEGNLR